MFFQNKTKRFFESAEQYTQGMLQTHRCNLEEICDTLQDPNYFRMQHFISESNWSYRDVMDTAAIQASRSLRKSKLTGFYLDETGVEKKGEMSVGVGWQYNGNVGKLANSQVAVMGCLCNGDFSTLVDARLYLPEDWCNDPQRCDKAGIPDEERVFKTKIDFAFEMIQHQVEVVGSDFDFVGADGLYGNDYRLARKEELLGLIYMFDIHCNQPVCLEKPELVLPERKGNRGPKPKRLMVTEESIKVSDYVSGLGRDDWEEIKVRNTAKGSLKGLFHFQQVYIWDRDENLIERRLLVVRKIKTKSGYDIKYSFTNADLVQYTPKALAYMQAQRFFIEHNFKEAKSVLGMDQFQTRKWVAWYHQVALNIMTMGFMLKEKLLNFKELPLLSARDIKDWLSFVLATELTEFDVIQRIYNRHRRRQYAINCCYLKEYANVSK